MEFRIYPQLPASGIGRARAWYSQKLGLEPVADGDELFSDTGTAQFGVYPSENAGTNQATYARLVAADFDAARSELLSCVVFEDSDFGDDFRTSDGVLVSPDGEKTSWFKDSEGTSSPSDLRYERRLSLPSTRAVLRQCLAPQT